ncbi:MAG: peptidylprolyl isomerase [Erythrobacter sp.]
MIRSLLREPLVHFLLAGAAIYLGLTWFGDPVDPASRTIVLADEDRAGIALGFERTTGRPPTDAEMAGLVDRWVREEVLYREALRLGLDQGDPVVRRRMATKMDELASAAAETATVDDATLEAWLKDNPQRFAEEGTVSFDQRYFASESAARSAMGQANPAGSPISLPARAEDMQLREIREVFGQQFTEGLARLEPASDWQGPVASGFGWHIIRLTSREAGELPPLAQIRERVEADWRNATIAERREQAYQLLREAYRVETE